MGNNTPIVFSTVQSPTHSFGVGNYSIILNASNIAGYDISNKVTFINVTPFTDIPSTRIGVVRNGNTWFLDASGNGAYGAGDAAYTFGKTGDVYVTDDWNTDAKPRLGLSGIIIRGC